MTRRIKLGRILLGAFLLATGLYRVGWLPLQGAHWLIALLAIAAGIAVLLDR